MDITIHRLVIIGVIVIQYVLSMPKKSRNDLTVREIAFLKELAMTGAMLASARKVHPSPEKARKGELESFCHKLLYDYDNAHPERTKKANKLLEQFKEQQIRNFQQRFEAESVQALNQLIAQVNGELPTKTVERVGESESQGKYKEQVKQFDRLSALDRMIKVSGRDVQKVETTDKTPIKPDNTINVKFVDFS